LSYFDRLLDPFLSLLKGDKPGHEFHGNQHTGPGGAEEPGKSHDTLSRRHTKEYAKAQARGDAEAMAYHAQREKYHFDRGRQDRPIQSGWSHGTKRKK
jgi:hypothetical protein